MAKIATFGIILDNNNRVLLCHRRDMDLWNLPGGGCNDGESPWDACAREVKEEVGLDVEVKRLNGIYFKPVKNELVFVFICDIVGGKIQQTDEADDINYFSLAELPDNIAQKHIKRIKDASDNKKEAILEIQ